MEKINLSAEIRKGLEEWAGEAHSSRFIAFYLALLQIQAEVEAGLVLPEPGLSKQELEECLRGGSPVFSLDEQELDRTTVNRTFCRIAALFSEYPEVLGTVPKVFLSADFELPVELARAWLEGGELPAEINGEKMNPLLLGSLIQQTLRPFLIGYGQALAGRYNQDTWLQSRCPVCGSDAEFAYLEKEAGARWLVCSTCCAEWRFHRTKCPFCGNADHQTLSYYTGEDGLYRLYLCQKCKGYLKAIDLRKTTETKLPALEALTTLAMDRQGQEMGYHRGGSHGEPAG